MARGSKIYPLAVFVAVFNGIVLIVEMGA